MTGKGIFARTGMAVIAMALCAGITAQDAQARRKAKQLPIPTPALRPAQKHDIAPIPHLRPAAKGEPGFTLANLPRPAPRPAPEPAGNNSGGNAGATPQAPYISSAFAAIQGEPLDGTALAGTALADEPKAQGAGTAAPEQGVRTAALMTGDEDDAGKHEAEDAQAAPIPSFRPAPPPPSRLISKDDYALLKQAFASIDKLDFPNALALMKHIGDAEARALIEWSYVTHGPIDIGYERMASFVQDHAGWPERNKLQRRMEEALFADHIGPARVIEIFKDSQPQTGAGKAALAWALLKSGDEAGARTWIRNAWRNERLTPHQEQKILARFQGLLGKDDHKARFELLLYRGAFSAAKSLVRFLPEGSGKLLAARIAVEKQHKNAGTLLAGLPASLRNGRVAIFSRVQWLRRKDKASEAAALMLKAPRARELLRNQDEWWEERHLLARAMLAEKKYDVAYKLAAAHSLKQGADFAAAEFLAGWIALRHIKDPASARKHFTRLRHGVERPISISRAEYWLGRTYEAENNHDTATRHYANASSHSIYFYGQLARLKLGGEVLFYPELPKADDTTRAHFDSLDLVRAVRLLEDIGQNKLTRLFLTELARQQHEPEKLALTATLASNLGMRDIGYRVGKISSVKGIPLVDFAYMTDGLPIFQRRGEPVEDALLHALVRQESAFNTTAVSHAGAQGLMQLMPPTAKAVAKQHGAPFNKSRLLTDPAYNAMLGTAHLGDLISTWGGSYIMAVAAYNAGEYRLKQWIDRFGDPRDARIDPIDWIESIPFNETRDYVHRVLENLQVYRARLNNNHHALQILADLVRGRDGG